MDYNMEEADRAREAAINKFLANDFSGARLFALKAQSLNPEIVGIKQMVATFHTHLAAHHTINGEMDYYGVLGVHPQADDDTVKKRYQKLAVMLHPDKNKSIGAGAAFELVRNAWSVLSDKAKRAKYDSKRNNGLSEGKEANNGVQEAAAKGKTPKRGVKRESDASASSPPAPPAAVATTCDGTFWSVCISCRTEFEYHRVYLNQNLICPHCRKPFIAVEKAPPHSGSIRNPFLENQFDSLELGAAVCTGTNKNAAHGSQAVPRESTKKVVAATPSTNPPKRRKAVENTVAGGSNVPSSSAPPKSNCVREFSEEELKNVLVKKSKPTIVTNLQDLITNNPEAEDVNMANAGSSQDRSAIESCCVDFVEDTTTSGKTEKDLGSLTIKVPDPEFYDFKKNRTEKSFSDNEIWASYDSVDGGMPRVYFVIEKVISLDPFKLCITQLTSSETNWSSNWLGSGAERTCGVFRYGDSQIVKSPNIFSHKVEVVKGHHGEFLIYPRTGDVWALYKNWPYDWNCYLEGGNKAVEYDVVEVVNGYTEEYGVMVVPLMKVAGYKSVFRYYLDPDGVRSFSKDELSRFSHQIPSYLFTGQDAADELGSCRVLDPAATPHSFFG